MPWKPDPTFYPSPRSAAAAPREELAWLVSHGSLRHLNEGEVLSAKGVPVAGLFVVLTGHVAIFVDRGAGRHKVMEWRAGDVAGLLPYSRLVSPPGDSVAQEPSEILAVPRRDLAAMIRDCHEITSILVHKMLDRARHFTSSGLHDEKMLSLGKLSAGLAHELNNPASAIERSAALLGRRLEDAEQSTRALGASGLTDPQLLAIDAVRASCLATPVHGVLSRRCAAISAPGTGSPTRSLARLRAKRRSPPSANSRREATRWRL